MQNKPVNESKMQELEDISWRLSRQIIEMTTKAGSGHPSSSLSAIDLMTVLFFGGVMRYDPQRPDWAERDRFILSKGHAAPALYAVLAEAGYFGADLLGSLRQMGSPLEGHPNMRLLPGVEASTGSLGQGLSLGLGHALAAKLDRKDFRVYVIIGDGESEEGQIWEATMAATKYRVDNLTLILDHNKFQQTGSVEQVMPSLTPPADKWRAFGWHVEEIDGHNLPEIREVFGLVQQIKDQPQLIVAHTKKGKGLTTFEQDQVSRKHGKPLEDDATVQTALAELARLYNRVEGNGA
ncbi:MAG TPA: transketolase [Anaerolineae bacterium]|nr:transketolase [Anaerolineae bacterium]HMR64854.1 transketolase [Anaerolineae bacterium]